MRGRTSHKSFTFKSHVFTCPFIHFALKFINVHSDINFSQIFVFMQIHSMCAFYFIKQTLLCICNLYSFSKNFNRTLLIFFQCFLILTKYIYMVRDWHRLEVDIMAILAFRWFLWTIQQASWTTKQNKKMVHFVFFYYYYF